MKLAEALLRRSDIQNRLRQIAARLRRNAQVQQGEAPAEDPDALLAEHERLADELEALIRQINVTNLQATLPGSDQTLTAALAHRDVLGRKFEVYNSLASDATITQDRYSKSEIKFESTVNVAQTQARADELAKARREIDLRIQQTNWQTELIEEA